MINTSTRKWVWQSICCSGAWVMNERKEPKSGAMVHMIAKDLPWCPTPPLWHHRDGGKLRPRVRQKGKHLRCLNLLNSPTSLQSTPGFLWTRNGEARTFRKILVKENQSQEVDRGWLKLTFAQRKRHVARRKRSSNLLSSAWGLVLSSGLPLPKRVRGSSLRGQTGWT